MTILYGSIVLGKCHCIDDVSSVTECVMMRMRWHGNEDGVGKRDGSLRCSYDIGPVDGNNNHDCCDVGDDDGNGRGHGDGHDDRMVIMISVVLIIENVGDNDDCHDDSNANCNDANPWRGAYLAEACSSLRSGSCGGSRRAPPWIGS